MILILSLMEHIGRFYLLSIIIICTSAISFRSRILLMSCRTNLLLFSYFIHFCLGNILIVDITGRVDWHTIQVLFYMVERLAWLILGTNFSTKYLLVNFSRLLLRYNTLTFIPVADWLIKLLSELMLSLLL